MERPLGTHSAEDVPTLPSRSNGDSKEMALGALVSELNKGRYDSNTEIARGGMGKILTTTEKPLRRTVAQKFLINAADAESQKRLIREARILGQLEHPGIIPVHDLSVDSEGRVFYTMKLVKGATLLQILHDLAAREPVALNRYPLPILLTIFQKVCDAVAFAHSHTPAVIHRDLKPENIMVGDYGEVLVMDWGAAKLMNGHDEMEELERVASISPDLEAAGGLPISHFDELGLTLPNSVMGTPGYMAPEQAAGRAASADQRTDVYALGAILYALLTLDAPVRVSGREVELFEARAQSGETNEREWLLHVAPLLSDRSLRPRLDHLPNKVIPDSLAAVVLKAMARRPDERFASVKELQEDVSAYQAGFATRAERAPAWKRFELFVRRNKVLFVALVAVFVVLVTATTVSLHQRKIALASNISLQLTLQHASLAYLETARQRFHAGAWREGIALLGRSLSFWPENHAAANYLLSAIAFGRGDRDKLPILGIYHEGAVIEAAFSHDGRYFATASYDHTTKVWDALTGAQVGKTLPHAAPCNMPSFSPDGRRLVTTGEDGLAMLWETQTGKLLAPSMHHGRPDLDSLKTVVTSVFSLDGKRILTGSFDHTARLWDAQSGKEISQLVNPQRVASAVFSPDESRILTSYWYGGAILWDAKTLQPIGQPMQHGATDKRSLFTPDGNKIITTSLDKTARIWDGHTAMPLSPPLKHDDFVWDMDISPDGKLFATACYDKKVRLWSVEDGTQVGISMEHQGPVDTVAFSPDGKRLVSASRDHTVRIWDVATCQPVGNPMRHDETVLKAIFNPVDGTKVLSTGWDYAAYLWDARSLSWPGEIIPIPGQVCSIEFGENDDQLFVATRAGDAGLWSLKQRRFMGPMIHQDDAISRAAFHPVSNQLATADGNGVIRFWNARNGEKTGETQGMNDPVMSIGFAVDGKSLFAAYLSGSILQWKIPQGAQVGKAMKHSEKMDALTVAPSGREIASGCRDDYLYLWDLDVANPAPRRLRHTNPVLAAAYDPTGRFVATGCDDHTARIWSVTTEKQVGEPFYLNGRATEIHFTRYGEALLVGGVEDEEVSCYDTRTHDSMFLPLPHPTGVSHVTSNSSGSIVITVTNDGVARQWRIPTTSQPIPKWLPDYLRALGGLTFSSQQQLVEVSTRDRIVLRKKLLDMPADKSIWNSIMRSSLASIPTEASGPLSQTNER